MPNKTQRSLKKLKAKEKCGSSYFNSTGVQFYLMQPSKGPMACTQPNEEFWKTLNHVLYVFGSLNKGYYMAEFSYGLM